MNEMQPGSIVFFDLIQQLKENMIIKKVESLLMEKKYPIKDYLTLNFLAGDRQVYLELISAHPLSKYPQCTPESENY